MFVGSELAGQRAAIVTSLVQSARLYGHDPWAYLRDVRQRLPSLRSSRSRTCCRTDAASVRRATMKFSEGVPPHLVEQMIT